MCVHGAAFAALKTCGSVVTWGDRLCGGNSDRVKYSLQRDVRQITSSYKAFTAEKQVTVVSWGMQWETKWGRNLPDEFVIG